MIDKIKEILDKVCTSRQYGYITSDDKNWAARQIANLLPGVDEMLNPMPDIKPEQGKTYKMIEVDEGLVKNPYVEKYEKAAWGDIAGGAYLMDGFDEGSKAQLLADEIKHQKEMEIDCGNCQKYTEVLKCEIADLKEQHEDDEDIIATYQEWNTELADEIRHKALFPEVDKEGLADDDEIGIVEKLYRLEVEKDTEFISNCVRQLQLMRTAYRKGKQAQHLADKIQSQKEEEKWARLIDKERGNVIGDIFRKQANPEWRYKYMNKTHNERGKEKAEIFEELDNIFSAYNHKCHLPTIQYKYIRDKWVALKKKVTGGQE